MHTSLPVLGPAMRRLRRTPLFFAAACVLLIVAVAGNAAMFAVVNAVVLRPLPVRDENQLAAIHVARPGTPRGPASVPLFDDVRQSSRVAGAAAAFQWSANLADEIEAERLQGMRVSADYFAVTGAGVALGRALSAGDSRPDSPRVALLADGIWKRRFGGTPSAIGRSIRLNGDVFTIVGVLRPDFPSPVRDLDVVAPWVQETDPRRSNPAPAFLRVVARLAPGTTPAQAQEDLNRRLADYRRTYPRAMAADQSLAVIPLRQDLVGNSRQMLTLLAVAMGIVMLVAVANLASLFMVNGASRSQEFATRRALGASNRQILGQLLSEACGIAIAGAMLGVLGASLVLQLVLATGGTAIPRSAEVSIDAAASAFGAILATLIALLAMLPGAIRLSRGSERLVASQRWATFDGRRLRAWFVCAQVALSVTLVASAGLLVRSFAAVQRVQPGFEPSGVLSLRLSLPRTKYPETKDLARFTTELAERIRSVPGVTDVAASNVVPMNSYLATAPVGVPGVEGRPVDTWPEAHYRMVSPRYFSVMGIPVTGRAFEDADDASGMPVAIVSRSFAARHWPRTSPIGQQISMRDTGDSFRALQIVGVSGDVRHLGLEVDSPSEVYVPIPQVPDATSLFLANNMYWVAKTRGEPLTLATPIRRQIAGVDRDVAASFVRTMEQWLDQSVQARRFNLRVIIVFALTALVLTTIGVYGVAAEAVITRTREIGVRAALGATHGQLRRMMLKGGVLPVTGGVALGVGIALGAANLLTSFLYGVKAYDVATFGAVSGLMVAIGALAYYIPASRVSRIDPVVALRGE